MNEISQVVVAVPATPQQLEVMKKVPLNPQKKYGNQKFYNADFTELELRTADLRNGTYYCCNFDSVDMRYANLEGSNFYGSTFRNTIMTHVNAKDAVFEKTKFDPKDCMGMTFTLKCETFADAEIGGIWAAVWLFMPCLMKLPDGLEDKIIALLGKDKYLQFKAVFNRRVIS